MIPPTDLQLFKDVIDFMTGKNFVSHDILGHNYRPLDQALWQVDMIFVNKDSSLLSSRAW